MTPPMIIAFFAMMAFNLVDTWYVSRLGTVPLAAMGFTFPIMMVLHSLAMGMGIGTSSCVSRTIGMGDRRRVRHLVSYAVLLSCLIFIILSMVAWPWMPRIISILGASGEARDLAVSYMRALLPFMPLAITPMITNNAIRATGNTLHPSLVLAGASLVNAGLDPLLIFGWGPVPAMGVAGAALATGLSRVFATVWALWISHRHFDLLTLEWTGRRELFRSWAAVLHVAIPSSATNLLLPITMGIVTRMIAGYGEYAVAATAAGQRIEHFAYVIPIAMGTVLVPLLGQNWGANRIDRVWEAWRKTNIYGITYSVCIFALSLIASRPVASCFSDNPDVVKLTSSYIRVLLGGAILVHSAVHAGFAFNAIGKPMRASLLMVIRLVGLVIPLAWIGSELWGVTGVYAGISFAHVLTGTAALFWFPAVLKGAKRHPGQPCTEQPECTGLEP